VAELRKGGVNSPAAINLAVDKLRVRGSEHPVAAHIAATDVQASNRGINLTYLLGGGLGGGVLGAILGGTGGALVGTAVGAGAGTLVSLGTTGREAKLPAGTALAVQLDQPLPIASLRSPTRH
jgi:outer membrane lipoprotein SlyB